MKKTINLIILLLFTGISYCQVSEDINKILVDVLYKDQHYRTLYDKEQNSIAKNELNSTIYSYDKENQEIVLPIIERLINGEDLKLDEASWHTCFLVLQHADLETQLKYKDFVLHYYKAGKIKNYEYLIFIDRINVNTNRSQTFGSQVIELPNDKLLVYPYASYDTRAKAFNSIDMNILNFSMINGSMRYSTNLNKKKKEDMGQQYPIVALKENDFVFLGAVIDKQDNKGVAGIQVLNNNTIVTTTDNTGYFQFIVNKIEVPKTIRFKYNNLEYTYETDTPIEGTDFRLIVKATEAFK
ncbi:hypothetical protein HMPREF9714_02615 [Myroides odoratimimus CCUG 12901]|uniref:hypothetical protein n=1 Tax=Myroides odoratimimus TaxID=76832 RepID=UPI000246097C|nr:hypothetical protein [Myroides odoratimimus]EHO07535.1 hypothetical protein HMPREF9714_02615 [Myroides odoratimimus CCUG 12901]MDM1400417.1 hypothetical protein [Myroides odoratimimus]MDM1410488.1 hypothetical protein [Myroides odoratimimus]MDM1535973.1 hypothetical protein [Myroides odoratimimus]MDM1675546.1 hypothetical protein [Myroides odoratimimus]